MTYSALDATIALWTLTYTSTDIAITVPHGTYGRIAPRSSLLVKHHVTVEAGAIDHDYTGPAVVILHNMHLTEPGVIKTGDHIAQLILESIQYPIIEQTTTPHGSKGFGSTGTGTATLHSVQALWGFNLNSNR